MKNMNTRTLKQGETFMVGNTKFTVNYNMQDYSNAPFFQKKLAQAKASIAKCPLPDMRKYLNPTPPDVEKPAD